MKERNLYYDNVKFILIFLVVLGHFANLNRSIPIMGGINNVIYSFHMPLFIFISGYFSRNIDKQRKAEIDNILYVYIVFEMLHYVFTKVTSMGVGKFNVFTPTYQNWYILGVFFWRLLIPYFNFYPKWISLLFIFLISFMIGIYPDFGTFLGLYRIIYFMPIFVLGYYSENFVLYIEKFKKIKLVFILTLILILTTIYLLSFYNESYNKLISYAYTPFGGYKNRFDLVLRFLGMLSSIVIGFFILFIIPTKKTFFTSFGTVTLNVFLLHMFLVFPINKVFSKLQFNNEVIFIVSIISSICITFFLSLKFVNYLMKPFVSLESLLSFKKKINFLIPLKKKKGEN